MAKANTLEPHSLGEACGSGFQYPEPTGNGSMADRGPSRRGIKILRAVGGWRGPRSRAEGLWQEAKTRQ